MIRKNKAVLGAAFIALSTHTVVFGQEYKKTSQAPESGGANVTTVTTTYAGMVGISFSSTYRAMTFGGPKFAVTRGGFQVAAGFYPSLVHSGDYLADQVRPVLGAGLEASYKGFVVYVPFYYLGNQMKPSFGFGFRW